MSNPRVLLVSYQFPPAGGVAVQRMLSLAKYLPRHGYDVHVLSCRNPGMPVMDPSLCRHIPPEVKVHRTISPEPPYSLRKKVWGLISRSPKKTGGAAPKPAQTQRGGVRGWARDRLVELLCPDPEVVWVPFAIRRARRIIQRHEIGTVVVTAPPFSSFSIGVRLKREFPELQFVADYRDDWLGYYVEEYDQYKNDYLRRRAIELEREMVESADRVVCVTTAIAELLRARYPDQPPGKIACVYNGYDPESFTGFRERPHGSDKVVVTYTGTLHKASSARYYLAALDALPGELRAKVETRFIGRVTDDEAVYLDRSQSETRRLGFLSQREAFQYLEKSDYLLVTMMHAGSVTGKVFEYLATGKPILAFGPRESEMARLIAATGAGWCVDPADDPARTAALLERLILRRGNPEALGLRPDREAIRRFDRCHLAGEYGRIISGIAAAATR